MKYPSSIFSFIKTEESATESQEVQIYDNWSWNIKKHIQMSLQFLRGKFTEGANDFTRPFKKVIKPILNLRFRAEDIEVKDIVFYVEEGNARVLSFFIKKYWEDVYSKEHNVDDFIDEVSEEEIVLGGVIVEKAKDMPRVLHLEDIAFCDQTDILGGPIGFKLNLSPASLRGKAKLGWGDKANGATATIEDLIDLAEPVKETLGQNKKENRTSGLNIEVYIVYGMLPVNYLKDNDDMEKFTDQIQIVAFYKTKQKQTDSAVLYRKEFDMSNLKFYTNKEIRGRALGEAGAEDLFDEQIWTNFLEIHKMNLLESAAKVPLYTDDTNYAGRNQIQDMENLEITQISSDSKYGIRQVPTAAPANIQLFERSVNEWFESAQIIGSAGDPVLGVQPPSGTPFRLQERVVREGKGIHEYRRGKKAKFFEEIFRDWIIPDIKRQITKGKKFLSTLTTEEMDWVMNQIAENRAHRAMIDSVLDGEFPEEKEVLIERFKQEFSKKGSKQILEILRDEFKGIEMKIDINIAGKQKDLAGMTDKLTNVFQAIFSNPQGFQQAMQIPALRNAFNDMIEFSGLSPQRFSDLTSPVPLQAPVQATAGQTESLQDLTKETVGV